MRGRLLLNNLGDPYANVAFEEALLRAAKVPTLRVWENQKCVVIGRGQLANFETDVEYDLRHSIPIVRRVTAGGAVYHGPGNLNWTFYHPQGSGGFRERLDAKGVFIEFAALLVEALENAGARCRFLPPNSLVDDAGKVSGMAAYVSKEAVLCHGTLLLDADLEEVQRVTSPSREPLKKKYPRSKHSVVSNCKVEGNRFVKELAKTGGGYARGMPSRSEVKMLEGLLLRYRSPEWNLGDPFELDYL